MADDSKKRAYLKGLFEKPYLSDIKERYNIRNDAELEELINILASSIGGLTNPTKLEKIFKTVKRVSLSVNTINSYLELEVDFVCNDGGKRCYIQSALHLPSEEKREQEIRSLKCIDDSFQKFVITGDPIKRYQDNSGVMFMILFEFLEDGDSLVG